MHTCTVCHKLIEINLVCRSLYRNIQVVDQYVVKFWYVPQTYKLSDCTRVYGVRSELKIANRLNIFLKILQVKKTNMHNYTTTAKITRSILYIILYYGSILVWEPTTWIIYLCFFSFSFSFSFFDGCARFSLSLLVSPTQPFGGEVVECLDI